MIASILTVAAWAIASALVYVFHLSPVAYTSVGMAIVVIFSVLATLSPLRKRAKDPNLSPMTMRRKTIMIVMGFITCFALNYFVSSFVGMILYASPHTSLGMIGTIVMTALSGWCAMLYCGFALSNNPYNPFEFITRIFRKKNKNGPRINKS